MAGFKITGIIQTARRIKKEVNRNRNQVKRVAERIRLDLTRKARDNAPVREGKLIEGIDGKVTDRGYGHGIIIEVWNSDVPYANRMHEGHYQAHPKSDVERRTSRKTGISYYKYKNSGKGLRGYGGGFWRDSKGNLHGRKYLTRADMKNRRQYIKALEAAGARA